MGNISNFGLGESRETRTAVHAYFTLALISGILGVSPAAQSRGIDLNTLSICRHHYLETALPSQDPVIETYLQSLFAKRRVDKIVSRNKARTRGSLGSQKSNRTVWRFCENWSIDHTHKRTISMQEWEPMIKIYYIVNFCGLDTEKNAFMSRASKHKCIHTHTHILSHTHTGARPYTWAHTSTHTSTRAHTHEQKHSHSHTHVSTHSPVNTSTHHGGGQTPKPTSQNLDTQLMSVPYVCHEA